MPPLLVSHQRLRESAAAGCCLSNWSLGLYGRNWSSMFVQSLLGPSSSAGTLSIASNCCSLQATCLLTTPLLQGKDAQVLVSL